MLTTCLWRCCYLFFRASVSRYSLWLLMRHGSINMVPASIGLESTDQTWHREQWLHFKFAGRRRRRDVSPAGSKLTTEDCAASKQVNDRRRASCASESPVSRLRCSLTVPAAQTSCSSVVVGVFCSFSCHLWVVIGSQYVRKNLSIALLF